MQRDDIEPCVEELAPDVKFMGDVDTFALESHSGIGEEQLRQSLQSRLTRKGVKCLVVMPEETLRLIEGKVVQDLGSKGWSIDAPYRVEHDGIKWEIGLVLPDDIQPKGGGSDRFK